MKISTLFAASALTFAALLFVSPSTIAGQIDVTAGPILGYEDMAYPAVCDLIDVNAEAVAIPMAECSSPAAMSAPSHGFVLANLIAPASIYELPFYVHFDPGRIGAAVS